MRARCLILAAWVAGPGLFAAEKLTLPDQPVRPEIPVSGALVFKPMLRAGFVILYEQNFEKPDVMRQFVMTDPAAWKLSGDADNRSLELFTQSKYAPKVRSPFNIALIADKWFGDFTLEVELLQTGKEYGHRDMCIIFGAQSPTRFYYVHLASKADPNAHNIFIVNEAPRKNFASKTTAGIDWGNEKWHRVRIERLASEGTIKVYFDNFSTPIMIGEDKTFDKGAIGFGSFDDTGKVDNVKIWGPMVESRKTAFFERAGDSKD